MKNVNYFWNSTYTRNFLVQLKCGFLKKAIMNYECTSGQLTISSHHFWMGLLLQPPIIDDWKWATDKRCIRNKQLLKKSTLQLNFQAMQINQSNGSLNSKLSISRFQVISHMNIFFTCKNTLVIMLQLYRLLILCLERRPVYRRQSRIFSMIPSEAFNEDSLGKGCSMHFEKKRQKKYLKPLPT